MSHPPVTVLTPVYNGEEYLAQCIESVLAQEYGDFIYYVVNNCSKDRSLEIAQSYVKRDPRVRVINNTTFVSAIDNHNIAFRLVAEQSRFCKVVSADDWITPDCLGKMVRLAEAHANVGIVGCYQRSGEGVKWRGIPAGQTVLSGRDAARLGLLHGIHVLGTPTSVLYRADLVRQKQAFFPHPRSHADTSACYESFRSSDLGFLHEVLSFERVHPQQWSAEMDRIDAGSLGYLEVLLQYGPLFLSDSEFASRKREVFDGYYRGLGGCLLKLKGRDFWKFHERRLQEMGCDLQRDRVRREAMKELLHEARNPFCAARKALTVLRTKFSHA
jgi:glycosyltransferase involved in cell wall biosynthesis